MLGELFSWTKFSEENIPVLPHRITKHDLDEDYKIAIIKQREFIADKYAKKTKDSSGIVPVKFSEHIAYMDFLRFCQSEIKYSEYISPYLMLIKYISSHEDSPDVVDSNPVILFKLFDESIKKNKEESLVFYREFSSMLRPARMISVRVYMEVMFGHFEVIDKQLSAQEDPLSMVPMFRQLIDDFESFAAGILWLLRRGVSPTRILQTNLLHRFMSYHLVTLHSEENPISCLYELLRQLPEAHELAAMAANVECEERGFYCEQEGGQSYTLTGGLCAHSSLKRVAMVEHAIDYTPTSENLDALYQLFGHNFLLHAIQWQERNKSPIWQAGLRRILNQEIKSTAFLASLINAVATGCESSVLETLAELLDDETIESLRTESRGCVLHLLPYKPSLPPKMTKEEIALYLRKMRSPQEHLYEVIPQIISLLSSLKDCNREMAIIVHNVLLDVSLENPSILEDRSVLFSLKEFPGIGGILSQKNAALNEEFNRCISGHNYSEEMTADFYHYIEDCWSLLASKLSAIQRLSVFHNDIPPDKYALQSLLAKRCYVSNSRGFDLDLFVRSVGISPQFSADGVSAYQRLLAEILLTIDDERIRSIILAKFEDNDLVGYRWMSDKYGGASLFLRAVKQGNMGLIRLLDTPGSIGASDLTGVLKTAAEAKQWDVVAYFCRDRVPNPTRALLKELLVMASGAGQLWLVELLASSINKLRQKDLVEAFVAASANGHLDIIQYLWPMGAPCAAICAKMLDYALQNEHFNVVDYIGTLPESPVLQTAVENELVSAVNHNQLHVVQRLCTYEVNLPSTHAIEKLFHKAIQKGHLAIVNYLRFKIPSAKATQTMSLAAAEGQLPIVESYYASTVPNRKLLQDALKIAIVKRHDPIAQFLRAAIKVFPQQYKETPKSAEGVKGTLLPQLSLVKPLQKSASCGALHQLGFFGSRSVHTSHLTPLGYREPASPHAYRVSKSRVN